MEAVMQSEIATRSQIGRVVLFFSLSLVPASGRFQIAHRGIVCLFAFLSSLSLAFTI